MKSYMLRGPLCFPNNVSSFAFMNSKCSSNTSHFRCSSQQNAVGAVGWKSPCVASLAMTFTAQFLCLGDRQKDQGQTGVKHVSIDNTFLDPWLYECCGPQTAILIILIPQSRTTATGIPVFCPTHNCSLQAGFFCHFLITAVMSPVN